MKKITVTLLFALLMQAPALADSPAPQIEMRLEEPLELLKIHSMAVVTRPSAHGKLPLYYLHLEATFDSHFASPISSRLITATSPEGRGVYSFQLYSMHPKGPEDVRESSLFPVTLDILLPAGASTRALKLPFWDYTAETSGEFLNWKIISFQFDEAAQVLRIVE